MFFQYKKIGNISHTKVANSKRDLCNVDGTWLTHWIPLSTINMLSKSNKCILLIKKISTYMAEILISELYSYEPVSEIFWYQHGNQ